jgi:hypothetical protein
MIVVKFHGVIGSRNEEKFMEEILMENEREMGRFRGIEAQRS